ncbi:FAD-dependent oxidoreductase [Kiloniella sp. b19]|uniref:FAD-dependent oxidoreductase n=1 Tax=Kiloniella sp. GXU_MW_B19 TaxID=3141326 RepID=UPI0031D18C00
MKNQTEVVVIGGGIGGCSTLYHLTQEGVSDCVLIERDEITSGTTWHSAAQVTGFGTNQTMIGLKAHSIRLYRELSEDPEYPINYHHGTGGLRLASTQDHLDGYRHFTSLARGMGVDFELIDAEEAQRRHPLITTDGLLGALWDPLDGDIDPAQLCQALLLRAKKAGAEVYRFNPVLALTQKQDSSWIVRTRNGDIHCEKVVNAGGYRCNEIAAMMGVQLPVASMEHQYLLTETIPDIEALDFRVPLIRCPTDDFYSRQEKNGLLLGFYEQDCKTWGLEGIDPNFTMALCPDDLDRVMDVMEGAFERVPCLMEAGIHSVINGPITYTPDGVPLVGKIPGKRNAYCITGLRAGLGEGGGHGWLMAQIIVHGEACYDTWCLDPRRFTRHANLPYAALKAVEDYQNEFRFHMPHEHRPAGRLMKTTPLYETQKAAGAAFTVVNGWERADYYKPDPDFTEEYSFRFNNCFEPVRDEVEAVRNGVGIMEVSGFNRYELVGESVHDALDFLSCSRVSRKEQKVGLAYFLNHQGNIKAEATLANLDDGRVWYCSAAAAELHDMDWLTENLPEDGSIRLQCLTNCYTTLVLAGPQSRALLQKAAPGTDWSGEAFPWLSVCRAFIGTAEAVVMSVSFSGELAYELHIPNEQLVLACGILRSCGKEFNLQPFGLRAAESMRLEKGYRHWKADLITEYNPMESGLKRFVRMDKDFLGRDALLVQEQKGRRGQFVSMRLEAEHASPQPGDSILSQGRLVGTVTSAGWGYRTGCNIVMGFVKEEHSAVGEELGVEVIGEPCKATVCEESLYDPEHSLVRS